MAKNNFIGTVLAGVAGGALALGGNAVYQNNFANTPSTTTTTTTNNGKSTTKVSYVVESDTTKAIDKVSDAVVSVINYQKKQSGTSLEDFLNGNFDQNGNDDAKEEEAGEGSGVIYKKDGKTAYVVTNNHVVEGASSLEVMLSTGEKVKGELVGKDAFSDLAVIKIDGSKVKNTAEFGDSSTLKVGEPAIAIGSPLGSQYANSATQGIISSLNRQVTSQNDNRETVSINAIQTDAAINPGNSGGALINIKGQVIGINSSKIASTSSSVNGISVEGMGFAIPSNDVQSIIDKLEKDGQVSRPALGIEMKNLADIPKESIDKSLKLPEDVTSGVVVTNVQSNMPAEKAGLKKYDVITKLGDVDTPTYIELQSALYKLNIGDTVKVTYYRNGKKETTDVKLTESNKNLKQSQNSNDQKQDNSNSGRN
ncbi:S1C family serine protease [Floricoccus penangensis]|uniref:Serine protease n=1 Tax=Floricoccus penangensis TaxID=1859475 RepID=A0A9Q5P1G4_9LACT|nr:trypsin-like peptidase domain-containing protein [Floricoccus penangensis]OFI47956.1 serine protease [Floricoccus penangensis]URZ87476.1 trypsin-like peptidase domain-containing protein [Floricoccus penangensis]